MRCVYSLKRVKLKICCMAALLLLVGCDFYRVESFDINAGEFSKVATSPHKFKLKRDKALHLIDTLLLKEGFLRGSCEIPSLACYYNIKVGTRVSISKTIAPEILQVFIDQRGSGTLKTVSELKKKIIRVVPEVKSEK